MDKIPWSRLEVSLSEIDASRPIPQAVTPQSFSPLALHTPGGDDRIVGHMWTGTNWFVQEPGVKPQSLSRLALRTQGGGEDGDNWSWTAQEWFVKPESEVTELSLNATEAQGATVATMGLQIGLSSTGDSAS